MGDLLHVRWEEPPQLDTTSLGRKWRAIPVKQVDISTHFIGGRYRYFGEGAKKRDLTVAGGARLLVDKLGSSLDRVDLREGEFRCYQVDNSDHSFGAAVSAGSWFRGLDERVGAFE